MTTPIWHYEYAGQQHGPISQPEMLHLIQNGTLTGLSRVWTTTLSNWTPLSQTELAGYLKPPAITPPPLPTASMAPPPLSAQTVGQIAPIPLQATTRPVMTQSISNIVVWVLAFAPIIGLLLEAMLAGAMATSEYTLDYEVSEAMRNAKYWYITLLLNIGLSWWDSQKVKQSGLALGFDKKLVFLVPVYLWKRAQLLQQTPAYFWVWIVCFVLSILTAQQV